MDMFTHAKRAPAEISDMPEQAGNGENLWSKAGKTKMLPLSYLKTCVN
jgi:hypothetical protein